MILCIVQARMQSRRLPGKVMKEIFGKPIIGYMLDRLEYSQNIDKTIVATSNDQSNDVLCEYLRSRGTEVFRGSEDNVLERFYFAANKFQTKGVMRLTADCPLIDPKICDTLINLFIKKKLDYITTGPSIAEGLDGEIFTFEVLKEMYEKATLKSEMEHVTQYVHNHRDQFNIFKYESEQDHSQYRIVVDEPEDFEVVKNIIEHFCREEDRLFHFGEIKEYLDENPKIREKNLHIIRNEGSLKSLEEDKQVRSA